MPSHEFVFVLEFSSQGVPVELLSELTARVFSQLGYSGDVLPEMEKALRQAASASGAVGERRCDVQFRAHAGKLDILVSSNGSRVWQTSQTIS